MKGYKASTDYEALWALIQNYYEAIKLALSIAWINEKVEIERGVFKSHRLGWKTAWKVASDIWIDD